MIHGWRSAPQTIDPCLSMLPMPSEGKNQLYKFDISSPIAGKESGGPSHSQHLQPQAQSQHLEARIQHCAHATQLLSTQPITDFVITSSTVGRSHQTTISETHARNVQTTYRQTERPAGRWLTSNGDEGSHTHQREHEEAREHEEQCSDQPDKPTE